MDTIGRQRPQMTTDPNMVQVEFYNRGREDVVFENIHPERHLHWFQGQPPKHWQRLTCKPDDWVYLPHQYYTASTRSGAPANLLKNFGNQIGRGNKHPSAPEVRRKFY